jgi:hypothetical protein
LMNIVAVRVESRSTLERRLSEPGALRCERATDT